MSRGKGAEDCEQTWARVEVRAPPIVPSLSCDLDGVGVSASLLSLESC